MLSLTLLDGPKKGGDISQGVDGCVGVVRARRRWRESEMHSGLRTRPMGSDFRRGRRLFMRLKDLTCLPSDSGGGEVEGATGKIYGAHVDPEEDNYPRTYLQTLLWQRQARIQDNCCLLVDCGTAACGSCFRLRDRLRGSGG
jgi:hypothetical protein